MIEKDREGMEDHERYRVRKSTIRERITHKHVGVIASGTRLHQLERHRQHEFSPADRRRQRSQAFATQPNPSGSHPSSP